MLEEVVQFLDKMEKDEWKEYWDLVLRITKNVVSRDPKNESAKNLIIEAERIAKKEEEDMEKSVIDEAGRVEIEESLDDFPAIKRKNEKRIQKIKLSQGVRLSMNGEWRWRGMKDHLELKKVGNYWLPSKGTNLQKRNMLLEAKEDLLAFPKDLPVQDLAIIVKHYLNRSVKFLKKKLKEDTQQKQFYETPKAKQDVSIDDNEKEKPIRTSDRLHLAYIDSVHQMYEKPIKAWLRLKALADKSRGSHLVEIPGFTKVYLNRDFKFPEKKLRYQFEPFKERNEGKLIDKAAFDTAWQRKKMKEKKSIKSQ
jgi:hypothetical protein